MNEFIGCQTYAWKYMHGDAKIEPYKPGTLTPWLSVKFLRVIWGTELNTNVRTNSFLKKLMEVCGVYIAIIQKTMYIITAFQGYTNCMNCSLHWSVNFITDFNN